MFEMQLTQCLTYGKYSINDSSYNDGGDKKEEGFMKDYNDGVFSLILSSHLKTNKQKKNPAICLPGLYEMEKLTAENLAGRMG